MCDIKGKAEPAANNLGHWTFPCIPRWDTCDIHHALSYDHLKFEGVYLYCPENSQMVSVGTFQIRQDPYVRANRPNFLLNLVRKHNFHRGDTLKFGG